jgi:GTP-binding protein
VAINKWDGLPEDARERVKRDYARKLVFLDFAKVHYISALKGSGVGGLLSSVDSAYAAAMAKLPTPRLTRVLADAVARQQPPRSGMTRPKLRYAHQGGSNPPLIVIHGTALSDLPESYRRYLEGRFCDALELKGTPLRIEFRQGRNPFVDR